MQRNLVVFAAVALLVGLVAAWQLNNSNRDSRLRIRDGDRSFEFWREDSGGYRSANGRTVTEPALAELEERARRAPTTVDAALDALGFEARQIATKRDVIVRTAVRSFPYVPAELPTELSHMVEPAAVRHLAWQALLDPERDRAPEAAVQIQFPSGLRLRCHYVRPWMLPHEIEADGRTWTTWDPQISRLLRAILGAKSRHSSVLVDEEYVKEGFWGDPDLWGVARPNSLGLRLRAHHSRTFWQGMSESAIGPIYFVMPDERPTRVELRRNELLIDLVPQEGGINRVHWRVPVIDGRPRDTWVDLVYRWQEMTRLIERLSWILDLADETGTDVVYEVQELDSSERLAAKRAGIRGRCQRVRLVSETPEVLYNLLVSPSDNRVVVTRGESPSGVAVHFSRESTEPQDRRYFVRHFDGRWELEES